MNNFAWLAPRTLGQAAGLASAIVADVMAAADMAAAGDAALIKAGGVDLLDLMKESLLAPGTIISIGDIPGLDGITDDPAGGVRIGALVTLAEIASNPAVRRLYPALADAVGGSASPQIRNIATLGGNLLQRPRCWYFRSASFHCLRKGGGHCFAINGESQYHAIFDNHLCAIVHPSTAATVLVALGAKVEITDATGACHSTLLEDFLIAPDQDVQRENTLRAHEIMTAILLPPAAGLRMAHLKQGERESFDWPLADVAVTLDLGPDQRCRDAAIILGAAAPVPHRAYAAQAALIGKEIDEVSASQAGHAALEGATPLAGNGYKLPLFEAIVRRAILAALAG